MKTQWYLLAGLLCAILYIDPALNAASNWTIYLRKAGPVRIGMTLAEVRVVLHDLKAYLAYGSLDPEPDDCECAYLETVRIPKQIGLMFQKGRLVRIDVIARGIHTASGAQVGDSEARIKKLYPGRIQIEPHHYIPETGKYLNYSPANPLDRDYGMVFETDNGVVTSFRVGTQAAIALVEGCS
jgi:hypothetical protein